MKTNNTVKIMNRGASLLIILITSSSILINGSQPFTIKEATIDDIQQGFAQNKLTSRQLVSFYLDQIQYLNPTLKSVVELNPDALDQADKADLERETNPIPGFGLPPLHGIPVLLKDSVGTKDNMNTTCGSYALLGSEVAQDAFVVEIKVSCVGVKIYPKTK